MNLNSRCLLYVQHVSIPWLVIVTIAATCYRTVAQEHTGWPSIAPSANNETNILHKKVERICVKELAITYDNLTLSKPWWAPQLSEQLYLRSSRPRPAASITLVTTFTLARLQPLELQCKHWPGPIAAAMYVARVGGRVVYPPGGQAGSLLQGATDTPTLIRQTRLLHDMLQGSTAGQGSSPYACMLDLALFTEDVPSSEGDWWSPPVSALLNRALAMASTELVLVVDGDYVPVPAAFQPFFEQQGALLDSLAEQLRSKGAALALLGLETSAARNEEGLPVEEQLLLLNQLLQQGSKDRVLPLLDEGRIVVSGLQTETNATHWRTATAFYPAMFDWSAVYDTWTPTEYDPPYLAVLSTLPYYDERYRGPYYNTAGHLYHMTQLPLQLLVHPTAYVLHYPHEADPMEDQNSKLAGKMRYLYYRLVPDRYRYNGPQYMPVINDDAVCSTSTEEKMLGFSR